ncbi:MAG: hypothetical protein HY363_03930 [Candidatus Aenigmarchaeota archaeon]|nr:hypothetical protein [Candidatus Aenigmarchaeota archaeon]
MNDAVVGFVVVGVVVLVGLAVFVRPEVQGFAIKVAGPDIGGPTHWEERRYICDLPNRADCIACCDEVKLFTKGPAAIVDYESCIFKVPKAMIDGSKRVWDNCIRVKAGLAPLEVPLEEIPELAAPRKLLPLAPYKICSLLKKKPEKSRLFLPYHPIMIASLVC